MPLAVVLRVMVHRPAMCFSVLTMPPVMRPCPLQQRSFGRRLDRLCTMQVGCMPSFCSLPAHGKVVSGSITYGWTGARTTAEQRWEKKKGTTAPENHRQRMTERPSIFPAFSRLSSHGKDSCQAGPGHRQENMEA
mmetsp:Transcript_36043/g.84317  ORF Transcript_36043/g.84317 Transcript_36043/m.84317 type:complete len:135 (+) Transcript_36043:91-495(+)